jgi:hypothetical protein
MVPLVSCREENYAFTMLMSLVRNGEVSEYEKERIRRIKENEDLIKELGL